jgi:diguanylate cyclase (GGDEF)-like protein
MEQEISEQPQLKVHPDPEVQSVVERHEARIVKKYPEISPKNARDLARDFTAAEFIAERQIAREKKALEEAQAQLRVDRFGFKNSLALDEELDTSILSSLRANTNTVVGFLDLDGFSGINNQYGHQKGDEAIKEIGLKIQEYLRATDKVFHISGDEFAMVLDRADAESVEELMKRIITAINTESADILGIKDLPLGVSIGITDMSRLPDSVKPSTPQDKPDTVNIRKWLLNQADTAMYGSKKAYDPESGKEVFLKNRVTLFDPTLNQFLESNHTNNSIIPDQP